MRAWVDADTWGLFEDTCLLGGVAPPVVGLSSQALAPPQGHMAVLTPPSPSGVRGSLAGGCLEQDTSRRRRLMKQIYDLRSRLYRSQMVVSVTPVIFRWVQ